MGNRRINFILLSILAVTIISLMFIPGEILAAKGGLSGTSLTVTKTVETEFVREYSWGIEKSVSPETIDMFRGDTASAEYTIDVTKTIIDTFVASGEICVSNTGSFDTTNLKIIDQMEYRIGNSKYQSISGASQTITPPQLGPGETECYPYSIEFTPIPDAKYRNSVKVTITNHAGKVGADYGPQVREDAAFPSEPTTFLGFDSIEVVDTNGQQFFFSDTGSQNYERTFSCDSDEGSHDNTATISETGQSDDATVSINCHLLEVTKDAQTSFTRQYNWYIAKLADIESVSGPVGFEHTINYNVHLSLLQSDDSEFGVQGNIEVHNPAPIGAVVSNVSDIVSPLIDAVVDCGVTFPYELVGGDTLNCTYSATLPDSSGRTNIATATLQNYDYDSEGNGIDSGTTDFAGTANVNFDDTPSNEIDECIDVTDTLKEPLGSLCADSTPALFSYSIEVTDFVDTNEPDLYTIENTASFTTNDTGTTGSSDSTVYVLVFDDDT